MQDIKFGVCYLQGAYLCGVGGRGVIDMHNFLGKPLSSLLLPSYHTYNAVTGHNYATNGPILMIEHAIWMGRTQ